MRSTTRWLRAGREQLSPALAIALELAPVDPAHADRLRAAQIASIGRLTPLSMGASCLNATILILALGAVDALRLPLLGWGGAVFGLALYYFWSWLVRQRRAPPSGASRRAIRRAIFHGALFGMVWGAMPLIAFTRAPLAAQLVIGCVTAGMMGGGGLTLATVPLAGVSYLTFVFLGILIALLRDLSPVYLALAALSIIYFIAMVANVARNASLFVGHFLIEAQLRDEVVARERAQAEAAHAQRIVALGELAGGIAHDYNNVLQVVEGMATSIVRRPEDASEAQRLARVIIEAAERGSAIGRRLLALGRREALNPEPIDVVEMLRGLRELLRPLVGPAIDVRIEAASGLGTLLGDRSQLETVFVNLAANARDAMPDGGVLTLSAATDLVAEPRSDLPLKPGRYARLDVADTGVGMDEEILARAGEPFFTTKSHGKGTGLGLSMAKTFAAHSGGAVSISSVLGHGTTVTIWLPEPPATAAQQQPAPAAVATGCFSVLVVDDDRLVRDTLIESLEDAGFAATGAESGAAALSLIEQGAAVDALVTNFAMPDMNGAELIRALRARKPGLPAIVLTGYVGDVARQAREGVGEKFTVLQKPVRPADLAVRLAQIIREASS
jgi:signal transduction histidine kinase